MGQKSAVTGEAEKEFSGFNKENVFKKGVPKRTTELPRDEVAIRITDNRHYVSNDRLVANPLLTNVGDAAHLRAIQVQDLRGGATSYV